MGSKASYNFESHHPYTEQEHAHCFQNLEEAERTADNECYQ